jgi:Tfp pilus assembly protein PilX
MRAPRRPVRNRGEQGTALIVALVFMLSMGLLIGVLVTLADTNLLATANLASQRTGQYASDAALETAVQAVRYKGPADTATACGSSSVVSVTIPTAGADQNLTVWCSSAALVGSRQVTFWACPTTSSSDCQDLAKGTALNGPTTMLAHAEVLYDDVNPMCVGSIATVCAEAGRSLIVEQWLVQSASG